MKDKKHFRSKWGFILASVGSAVGMANVWGFPNKLGSLGGGSFLLIYLFFIWLFSYVGLPTEFALGRFAKTGPLGTYQKAFETRKKDLGTLGRILAYLPLAGSMCIAIGYAIIVAYVGKALFDSITGTLMHVNAGSWFESFALQPSAVIVYHIAIVSITLLTIAFGANSIEKTNKVIMPLFFLIFLILAIRVFFLDGAKAGYKFLFIPNLAAFTDVKTWIFAMGQALFSLSITGSGMIVYGAYLSDDEDIISSSRLTAIFDTIAALIASLVIIPACFAYNLDVNAGPSLLFVTLPTILQDIPFGQVFAIILYTAMIFAGISSLQNMFEAVGESLMHRFKKLNRFTTILILASICLVFGLRMEQISQWGPWMDFVSIYIIPIGATIGAITWFFVMDQNALLQAINLGATNKQGKTFLNLGKFVYVPLVLALSLIALIFKISF